MTVRALIAGLSEEEWALIAGPTPDATVVVDRRGFYHVTCGGFDGRGRTVGQAFDHIYQQRKKR